MDDDRLRDLLRFLALNGGIVAAVLLADAGYILPAFGCAVVALGAWALLIGPERRKERRP